MNEQEDQNLNNVFYQDDRLDQLMEEDENMLNEDDVLMQDNLEDDIAMI